MAAVPLPSSITSAGPSTNSTDPRGRRRPWPTPPRSSPPPPRPWPTGQARPRPGALQPCDGLGDIALPSAYIHRLPHRLWRSSDSKPVLLSEGIINRKLTFSLCSKTWPMNMCTWPLPQRKYGDRAIRIARAERTVTCIIFPNDLQEAPAVPDPPRAHGTIHSGVGYSSPRVVPKEGDLQRAAELLNSGKKVAMLVGAGAL